MMRRRISVRCFVYFFGVPVTFWFMIQIMYWNFELSSNARPYPRRIRIKARKIRGINEDPGNSDSNMLEIQPDEKSDHNSLVKSIVDRPNEALVKKYDLNLLNELGIIKTPNDQKFRDEGTRQHAFNQLISDRIGFHRALPDSRNRLCHNKTYPVDLPDASIIICFYNEAVSALLRTVFSVIDRTPSRYLREILLVDDSSNIENLDIQLQEFINKNVKKVKYLKTPARQGLIRARMFGANHAQGKVIVFLDSHCEVNTDWLEPLLTRVQENRANVAVPIIDIINAETLEYQASPLVRGGFNWGLHYRWDQIPENMRHDALLHSKPIPTPTMAGGLFAMDRDYFNELGQYDSGMDIWGGENLEISFRIWQCGGRLEIIPCSRVGHIFRKRRPYGSSTGMDTMVKNSLRLAHVWMDKYKEYYLNTVSYARNVAYGDISDRIALRKHLKCKSFEWYLKNVYPEQILPDKNGNAPMALGDPKNFKQKPKVIRRGLKTEQQLKRKKITLQGFEIVDKDHHFLVFCGEFLEEQIIAKSSVVSERYGDEDLNIVLPLEIKHLLTGLCIQSEKDVFTKRALLTLSKCATSGKQLKKQKWSETEANELILADLLCMDMDIKNVGQSFARLMKCHGSKGSQAWLWTIRNGVSMLYNPSSGQCLSVISDDKYSFLTLEICSDSSQLGFEMIDR